VMEKVRENARRPADLRDQRAVRALPVMERRCGWSVRVCRRGRAPVAGDLFGHVFPN
jgi:hypothetical protein